MLTCFSLLLLVVLVKQSQEDSLKREKQFDVCVSMQASGDDSDPDIDSDCCVKYRVVLFESAYH